MRKVRHTGFLEVNMRIRNEAGASLVEYALLIALVAIISVAGVRRFGLSTADTYEVMGSTMETETTLGGSDPCSICTSAFP